ncbi:MAG: PKD domain-containing protein [Bacteroidetes bacterium]|nr:PKD domain-containing protein [Bacteroidota bacterium]
MNYKKIITTFFVVAFFAVKSFAQFTATWAFTSNNTGVKGGVNQSDISIADAVVGNAFTSNVGYGGNGVKCQPISGTDWVTSATDGWHIDFPISPVGAVDATLLGFTFAARTSGSSGSNMVSLAVQKDGVGAFVPFGTPQSVPSGGSSTITFPAFAKKLYTNHTYLVRMYMYAANSGTSASRSLSIKTAVYNGTIAPAGSQPSVTTATAIKTGKYTGTVTGVVTAGTYTITSSGVVWDVVANPTINLPTKNTSGPTASGNINLANGGAISGLTAATNYNVRAYVESETGDVFYGANLTFTTDAPTIPSLTTTAITNITSVKATSGGVIIDSGGVGITQKGVCWSILPNPTTADPKTMDGKGNVAYSSLIKILTPSTKYYVRAYAINSIGTAYGNEINFTTLAPEPIITTVTPNGQNSIPFGNVIVNNISAVKSYTLSASALNPANGNITISAPSGFQVSTNPGSGFASTLNISYTAGSIAPTTIYVRFVPTQFGDYSGTITHTGGGAIAINIDDVTVTGKGIQDPSQLSNTGTDFWLGYGFQALMAGSNNQDMALYISSKQDAVVTVEIGKPTDANYYIQTYNVTANVATPTFTLPKTGTQDARLNSTGILPRGIHVYSNGIPFSLWGHIYAGSSSGATMVLPTNTWGANYSVLTVGGKTNNGVPHSFFFVQAAEDNTIVDITPADDITATASGTTTLYPAGVPFSVTLNKGDVFNALGKLLSSSIGVDLTGTTVVSRDCNKKIALFTGNGRVQLFVGACNPVNGGSDNFIQQMFPKQAWGTKYLTSPFRDMEAGLYKVIVSDPATVVKVNGTTLSGLVQNAYSYETDTLLNIESDKPVMVAQFCATNRCNGTGISTHPNTGDIGDPEMVILSPTQQAINDVTVYSTNNFSIQHNYINVIVPNAGVASFMLDGVNVSTSFATHTADANYSYAVFSDLTGNTSHRLQSNVPFNAIAYGFSTSSTNESYGYNAGTQLKPLTQYLSVNNSYPNLTKDSVISACLNNTFNYTVNLPYKPLSMHWDFFNNPAQLPNADTILVTNTIPVDSVTVNGTLLYKYSLPTNYTFNATGTFPVNITVNATNADGCSGLQTITFNVKVVEPPVPHFLLEYSPCLPTILNYTDSSYDKNGYKMAGREWTFFGLGSNIFSTDSTPTITYNNPGTYAIKLRAINSIGCYKDLDTTVTLYGGPKIINVIANNNGPDCVGKSIKFTATTTTSIGTVVKYYWDFGDGKKDTTTTDTVSHIYTAANTTGYQVTLSIESSLGCVSSTFQIVQPIFLLKADFNLVSPQCVNVQANFTDASQGVNVTSPISASWLWSFGNAGSNTATTQNAQFTYTTDNTFNVKLRVALLNNGVEFCFDTITKPIVVTPVITISNLTSNPANRSCVGKAITYTAVGNTVAGSFKWYWDFGDGKKDTTTTNTTTHTFTSTATPFNVTVFAQLNGGCKGNTLSHEQYIYKVTAISSFTSPQCINTLVNFADASTGGVTNATIDTKWLWSFGDAANTTATTQNAQFTYNTAGTYNVKLKTYLVFGGTTEFCSHDTTRTLVINDILTKPVVTVDNAATTLSTLTFKWDAIANATGYQVSFDGGSWITPSSGTNGLTHIASGLTANTSYTLCVKAIGACPSDSACITGKTSVANSDVFIPNVFTPDGNGKNDKLIVCSNNIKSVQFAVYSQWGEKLFETTSPSINAQGCFEVWDGRAFGKMQPVGVYAYVSTIVMNDGKVLSKKGLVNLVR